MAPFRKPLEPTPEHLLVLDLRDVKVLAALAQGGSDLNQPRAVAYLLRLPDEDRAEAAADQAERLGYEAERRAGPQGGGGAVPAG